MTMAEASGGEVRQTVRRHAGLLIVQAALLIAAGLFAFVYPLLSSLAVSYFLGWVMIVAGVVQGVALVAAARAPHFWMQLVSAVLSAVVGVVFVRNPGLAVATLALLLVVYFMVEGIAKVALALTVRPLRNWGWVLASGIVGVLVALFLILTPVLSLVALGFFIGFQLVAEGIAIGGMAWAARRG
jgi:uncharacterized membrane protein HdeD (DUF308 family)